MKEGIEGAAVNELGMPGGPSQKPCTCSVQPAARQEIHLCSLRMACLLDLVTA